MMAASVLDGSAFEQKKSIYVIYGEGRMVKLPFRERGIRISTLVAKLPGLEGIKGLQYVKQGESQVLTIRPIGGVLYPPNEDIKWHSAKKRAFFALFEQEDDIPPEAIPMAFENCFGRSPLREAEEADEEADEEQEIEMVEPVINDPDVVLAQPPHAIQQEPEDQMEVESIEPAAEDAEPDIKEEKWVCLHGLPDSSSEADVKRSCEEAVAEQFGTVIVKVLKFRTDKAFVEFQNSEIAAYIRDNSVILLGQVFTRQRVTVNPIKDLRTLRRELDRRTGSAHPRRVLLKYMKARAFRVPFYELEKFMFRNHGPGRLRGKMKKRSVIYEFRTPALASSCVGKKIDVRPGSELQILAQRFYRHRQ